MITDKETNVLHLADTLPVKCPAFFKRFNAVLKSCGIPVKFIPGTNDVWAVDYMPVQTGETTYVQFLYDPDYLQGEEEWQQPSISDANSICAQMHLRPLKSSIKLDGGNVVRASDKVIMCNKVFKENLALPKGRLVKELEEILEVNKIVFIPQDPYDMIGHADGMVRFVDDDTVIINDYSRVDNEFHLALRQSLRNEGLDIIDIPFEPSQSRWSAKGIYVNCLQMRQALILPTFGLKEDDAVVKHFERLFKGQMIKTIDSNEIAKLGGVLNCISWNILEH